MCTLVTSNDLLSSFEFNNREIELKKFMSEWKRAQGFDSSEDSQIGFLLICDLLDGIDASS